MQQVTPLVTNEEIAQKFLPESHALDDIIEEDEDAGKGMLTPKSTQEGEPKHDLSGPGTKKSSAAYCTGKTTASGCEKSRRGNNSRPWSLFETTESLSKSGKHTSRTSITGSVKGDSSEAKEEDLDRKIESLSKDLEKLSHAERSNALPNYITARKYLYQIVTKKDVKKSSATSAVPIAPTENPLAGELHIKAQEFLKKYKTKVAGTPSNSTSSGNGQKGLDNFAEYLKSKYANLEPAASKGSETAAPTPSSPVIVNHKSPQYGYLMAQFKNPEAFAKMSKEKAETSTTPKSNKTKTSQTSFSEATAKLPFKLGAPVRPMVPVGFTLGHSLMPRPTAVAAAAAMTGEAKAAPKPVVAAAAEAKKTPELKPSPEKNTGLISDSHHIEVMVLCDKIHKLEGEVVEKSNVIEKLNAMVEALKKENEELKKENEKLKGGITSNVV